MLSTPLTCHRMLSVLADMIPVATRYATSLYAREPPELLFAMDSAKLRQSSRLVACNKGGISVSYALQLEAAEDSPGIQDKLACACGPSACTHR